jgi:hypothetical protein
VALPQRLGFLVATVVALVVAISGGGSAMASWLSGAGPTGTPGITVTAGAPTGALYPEPPTGYSTAGTGGVTVLVTNTGDTGVRLTTARLGAVTVSPLPGRTCASGSVRPVTTDVVALAAPVELASGGSNVPVELPGALTMLGSAEAGCQGAAITVEVTLSA